ncbi:MAG: tRNA lysidine(34) synthetase TilS, partial [Blastocatellia bacterium]|nr:tRNA lysidine(34) synthetase TilS [Blastocatellia bacterium]
QLAENVRLVRPLLETTREEVIAHCRHYELEFRHDSSNDVTSLTRNRVRHELLPLLRTFNPRFNESISRTAELATDEQNYLKRLSSAVYAEIHRAGEIEIEPLRQCHPALRRRILRLWLRDQRGGLQRIEMAHLLALENLIVSQSGHRVVLPYGWTARREFDRIILRKSGEILTNSFDSINLAPISLVHDCEVNFGRFRLFIQRNISCRNISCRNISRHRSGQPADSGRYFAYLRECDELDGLLVRTRIPGDAYLPSGGSHKIKLKTLMIKKRIPLSEREYYPLLVTSKGEIVWAPGLPVASRFSVGPGDSETMKCALVTAEKLGGRDVTNETADLTDLH